MSSSHYKWLEETLGARQTGLGQRPATAGRRRRPVQGLTIGEAATIIQARVRLLRAQYKSVSVAGIGAAELRLHALLALQRSRRRRAEKARRAEGSDGGKLARLRAATQKNVRQEKPAPLAKTLSSVRVGEEPDGALRFKGRVLRPPPKRASAQTAAARSSRACASAWRRSSTGRGRRRRGGRRRRAAAADRLARKPHRRRARPADAPAAGARARLTFNRSDPALSAPGAAGRRQGERGARRAAGKAALLAEYRKTGGRRDVDLSWTRLHELLRDAGLPARGATAVLAARFVDAGRRL